MSNDSKFWAYRIVSFVLFTAEGYVLFAAIDNGFSDHASSVRATLWFVLFGVLCAINVPVFILYRKAKVERWDSAKTQTQADVEILAAYAAQERAEKEAAALRKSPVRETEETKPKNHN